MTVRSNFLIVGSTGRNTGKTEFACRIIERHSCKNEIIGIKVIPVDRNESDCHRGLEGCGLCNSLTGDYKIIEETSSDTSKDTSRMLKAGAKKAYLLLVERNSLETGVDAMLTMLPEKSFVIVESNSIRKVLNPGLFIVIKDFTTGFIKPSCAEVLPFADKLVEFNNLNWDFDPENVLIQNESWRIY